MNDIGLLIKQIRIYRGLTQKKFLDNKFSTTYLSRIENGEIFPSNAFIEFISNKFNMSKNEFNSDGRIDETKISQIYNEFRISETISEINLALFHIYSNQSFSNTIYVRIYSVLIRRYLQLGLYNKAENIINQSKRFIMNIDYMNKTDLTEDSAYYLITCGNVYYRTQKFIEADKYYTIANKFILDEKDQADLYYNMSITKQRIIPNINISLYYSNKAYEIYAKQKLEYYQFRTMITIAIQNYLLGNFTESINQLKQAKTYMKKINNLKMLSKIEYNLGNIHQKKGDFKSAIVHYHQDLEYLRIIKATEGKFYVYRNLTLLYLDLKDFPSVDKYILKAFKVINEELQPFSYNEMLSIQAKVLKQKDETKRYQNLMEKIIENCIENNLLSLTQKLSAEIGEYYYQNKSYKKASYYLLKLID